MSIKQLAKEDEDFKEEYLRSLRVGPEFFATASISAGIVPGPSVYTLSFKTSFEYSFFYGPDVNA